LPEISGNRRRKFIFVDRMKRIPRTSDQKKEYPQRYGDQAADDGAVAHVTNVISTCNPSWFGYIMTLAFVIMMMSVYAQPVSCLDSYDKLKLFRKSVVSTELRPTMDISDSMYLVVNRHADVRYDYGIKGIEVLLVNPTEEEIVFPSSGILPLFCQAKNSNGEWIDLERLPADWNCYGNTTLLPSRAVLHMIMPCYAGPLETMLRFRMEVGKSAVYSLPFPGNINAEQLK
jgi:hypothetical protein